jgi:predicted metalloprotease
MRLDRMRRSSNVDDRRGMRTGGRGGLMVGGGAGGLILLVLYMMLGGNPLALLQGGSGGRVIGGGAAVAPNDPRAELAARVLGDTEEVWSSLFASAGREYREPSMVLFSGGVESACGYAESAVGPFYCPDDMQVYLDLEFFEQLSRDLGAGGDFAQAYVIAHEVGHHVQRLLGNEQEVRAMRGRISDAEYNDLSVRLELQADFYAGVWAHHAQKKRQILEEGDIEEGLQAASAVGDDRLQRRAQGYVVPDSFTHGTSEQRVRWFRKGFETGDPSFGDTFSVKRP